MTVTLPSSRRARRSPDRSLATGLKLAFAVVVGLAGLASAGCEDKAIGRVCDLQAMPGQTSAIVNPQALECPTRLCLKQVQDPSKAVVDTAPFCTAECSRDDDCESEERRGKGANDKRCKGGFVCGIAQEVGDLCCKKVCLCRDFVTAKGSLPTPLSCQTDQPSQCVNK